jgi:predicted dehydrogenase
VNRREFVKGAAALGLAGQVKAAGRRAVGANDRVNLALIGAGSRGSWITRKFARIGQQENPAQIVAVCDVYQKRVNENRQLYNCDGYLDWRAVIDRPDVDAVIVATPDHWHAPIALAALEKGKDVYLEKPMCHTVAEARSLVETVRATGRILQVGSQTTSAPQWWKARQAIADGAIGQMVMSQGSYHRNSKEGEWNWPIDAGAGPEGRGDNYIDWKTWLGAATARPWDPDRYFRFRKYWDYSGGIATDLFFHVAAPLNICWPEPQFPTKVMAGGGIHVFKDSREVPDTFHLIAEYAAGHTVVLSSSMANSKHIPGLIRGHLGTIIMVDHGKFEGVTDHITLLPEKETIDDAYGIRFGTGESRIPFEQVDTEVAHFSNFLSCVRTRQKPRLDVETAARAQVLISMSVQAYREGRTLYFDEKTWTVSPHSDRA